MKRYVLAEWPQSQEFLGHPDCFLIHIPDENAEQLDAACVVPEQLFLELKCMNKTVKDIEDSFSQYQYLEKMIREPESGLGIYNLGTGVGYSVLDIVNTFNRVNGDLVKYEITDRRPGDVAECYASPKKAEEELGFKAERGLEVMCKSSYEYQRKNK